MREYFIFISLCILLLLLAHLTRKRGYKDLSIQRRLSTPLVAEGEEFAVTIIIENNKWLPVSFLSVSEAIPANLKIKIGSEASASNNRTYHTTRYNILWYERIKRTYSIIGEKRGTYLIKNMELTLGDIFGFAAEKKELEDYLEILVMPKLMDLKSFGFDNNSLMGNSTVKRWLYNDPLYIRGIREYNVEDRMKDIHWKSSLKMNKLMVKNYDYTSDNEIIIIANMQVDEQVWRVLDEENIENMITAAASIAASALKEHIPTGMWTNAYIRSYSNEYKSEVEPSVNSYKKIMELSARMDLSARVSIEEYLRKKLPLFKRSCTYIIITAYLNDGCINLLYSLKKHGINILLIDASKNGCIPEVNGIKRMVLRGEKS